MQPSARISLLFLPFAVGISACSDTLPTSSPRAMPTTPLFSGGGSVTPPPSPSPAPGTSTLAVASLTIAPNPVAGGASAQGLVTLNAVPTSAVTVILGTDNSFVIQLPPSVTITPPSRTATFVMGTIPVTGTFTLHVFAAINSAVTTQVYITPTAQTDLITISRADLSPKSTSPSIGEVRIEASSTNASVTLTADYNGTVLGTLRNNGGGKFSGTFSTPGLDGVITVRSNLQGCAQKSTNRPTPSISCASL